MTTFDRSPPSLGRRRLMGGALITGVVGGTLGRLGAAQAQDVPTRDEWLIRGAQILTMDPRIPDMPRGDIHVREGRIVALGADLQAPAATAIDARDLLCMPGFIDTHWHLWTSLFRPYIVSDREEAGYFPVTGRLGPHMTPEDSRHGVELGLVEAIAAGVTTVHNWCHNTRSADHADAEITAMLQMGVRGRFAYGPAQGMSNEQPVDVAAMERTVDRWRGQNDLLRLGFCSRNVGNPSVGGASRGLLNVEQARVDWNNARRLRLPISLHLGGDSLVRLLEDAELLGPDVQLVHPKKTSAEDRKILRRRGVSYSMSPLGEARSPASSGVTQLSELLEAGVKVSLSSDYTTFLSCDPFMNLRLLHGQHLHRLNNNPPLAAKRLIQLATLDGAVDLGLQDLVGSLTPGKRADLILIRTGDLNLAPMGDPYHALVQRARPSNVDTVMIEGRVLRQRGRFLHIDHGAIVEAARRSASAVTARAKSGT